MTATGTQSAATGGSQEGRGTQARLRHLFRGGDASARSGQLSAGVKAAAFARDSSARDEISRGRGNRTGARRVHVRKSPTLDDVAVSAGRHNTVSSAPCRRPPPTGRGNTARASKRYRGVGSAKPRRRIFSSSSSSSSLPSPAHSSSLAPTLEEDSPTFSEHEDSSSPDDSVDAKKAADLKTETAATLVPEATQQSAGIVPATCTAATSVTSSQPPKLPRTLSSNAGEDPALPSTVQQSQARAARRQARENRVAIQSKVSSICRKLKEHRLLGDGVDQSRILPVLQDLEEIEKRGDIGKEILRATHIGVELNHAWWRRSAHGSMATRVAALVLKWMTRFSMSGSIVASGM
eukprot:TRINITY_DN34027_c0_g2_i1.p1 TRINITY_DN34027_c0_g2~~TRINITY_DN34027_c0_g2_i1.p1  ORF type:complete len:383 (+),score=58.76 TRINITY_DN34027_c0_g2_i1:102-1151(+)